MKKLFFYLSVAMIGVAAASCQKEVAVENPGDGNVTITIQTPGVETKAIADGLNVDIVYYEIYKNEEGHKNSLTGKPLVEGTVEMSGKEASLSLNLLQGQEYVGLFWAQVNGKNYYNVSDLRNVTVNYPNEDNNKTLANDEDRAAFCNYKTFATGQNVTVVLERPFAQINLGTSFQSLDIDYEIALQESSMTVTGVANAFNVAAMTAKTETENIVNVEFGMNTVPYAFDPSETLSANDDTWAYAGMNYVLVPGDASTVNVAYSIKTDVGTLSRTVSAVPVKKNFRTNLLGNLLTEETKIEIVVDERFNTPDLEPEAIYMAAAIGGEFTLTEDITLTEPLVIQSSLVLNLGGHTLKGGKAYASGVTGTEISAITVDKGATLTIEGEGAIEGSEYGVYVKNGNVVVKGGSITAGTSAVQVNVGTADIEGGVFSNTDATDTRYVINCIDANWKNGTAKVNITGGTFHNFNPAANVAEGAGTDFVNENCSVTADGDYYTVVLTTVTTAEELSNAFALVSDIKLGADIDLSNVDWTPVGTADAPFTGTFDGQGHKIIGLKVEGVQYAAFISHAGKDAVVKNLTLENVDLNSTKHAAGVVCVASDGVTLENVTVSGTIVAASYAGGILHNAANAVIMNCVNNANVTANRAGGIASWVTVNATIENVQNNGDITGAVGASGIAHGFAGSIKNAVNNGNIISNNIEAAAGIAGVQKGESTYEYCYNYGNVTSTYDDVNASAAGILGQNPGSNSTLKYCANYGTITAEQSYAAGIAYSLYGQINASYCYNAGEVTGTDGAGAIAPKAAFGTGDKASYCLNAGTITSSNGNVYQGSNNNVSCYYYAGESLYNVTGDVIVATNDALTVLNGGDDDEFFCLENGKIVVK